VYDFTDGDDLARLPLPAWPLTLLEPVRFPLELSWSLTLDHLAPRSDLGHGLGVLVLPGFGTDDLLTGRLRSHLRRHGFTVHGWGLGRNHGLTDRLVDGLLERFDAVAHEASQQSDARVSVVGWSFGGLLARWLAHQRPEQVRQVVCLGSPWRAEGEITRTTALFERAARRHGLSERARDIVRQLRGPLPVPLTVLWSRTDGVVNWRGCAVEGPHTQNIEVPSSHTGLPANPLSLAAVTDRLAQPDPWHPAPFAWTSALRTLAPRPVPAAQQRRTGGAS
jgi:pimeloyl-ACP methyl ester carboxylesterase